MFTPKIRLTALLIFIYSAAFSQDYMIRSKLQLDDTKAFVTLNYGRKDFGCGFINARGVMETEIPIDGNPVVMAKTGINNIILIYTEPEKQTSPTKVVHAVLIDAGRKKIVKDNIIYNNPGKNDLDLNMISDGAGNFISLLVRITGYSPANGGFGGDPGKKRKETNELVNVSLDKNLQPKETKLSSGATDGIFMQACGGTGGNIFLSSFSDGQVLVEHFDSLGNFKDKMSVNLPIKRKSWTEQVFRADSTAKNIADLAVAYIDEHKDDYVQLFRFDFNTMKTLSTDKVVSNKDYIRSIQNAPDDKSSLRYFGETYNLQPVQIIETADKIIVVKEIQSEKIDKDAVTEQRAGSVISVYSKDLKLLNEALIDKWCAYFIFSFPCIYAHPKNDQLYIITDEMKGLASYNAVLYNMNLNTGSISKSGVIDKDAEGFNWLAIPRSVMWFRDGYVVPFTNAKSFIKLSLETSLVAQKYKN